MKRFVLFSLLLPSLSFAVLRHVPVDHPTIQGAIEVSVPGDTVLVAGGIYAEEIVFGGRNVVVGSHFLLDGASDHVQSTILTPPEGGSTSLYTVTFTDGEDTTAVLAGFTITGGRAIACESASPTIRNCEIRDIFMLSNPVAAGIKLINSNAHVYDNHLHHLLYSGVEYTARGVAISVYQGSPIIRGNRIEENEAYCSHYNAAFGVGVSLRDSNARLEGNSIRRNHNGNSYGGGVCIDGGSPHLIDNLIEENVAATGAGILIQGGSEAVIEGGTVRNNKCDSPWNPSSPLYGAGICVRESFPAIGTAANRVNLYGNKATLNSDLQFHALQPSTVFLDTVERLLPDPRHLTTDGIQSYDMLYARQPNPQHGPYYLATDGDDEASGRDIGNPLRTLEAALRLMPSANEVPETLYLAPGRYDSLFVNHVQPTGNSTNLVIIGAGPRNTILKGNRSGIISSTTPGSLELRDLEIRHATHPLFLFDSPLRYFNVRHFNCEWDVNTSGASVHIEESEFYSNPYPGFLAVFNLRDSTSLTIVNSGFIHAGPVVEGTGSQVSIQGSEFKDNSGTVISLDGGTLTLANCLFARNGRVIGQRIEPAISLVRTEFASVNVTMMNSQDIPLLHLDLGANAEIRNGLFWKTSQTDTAGAVVVGEAELTMEYSLVRGGWVGEGNLDADPLFDNEEDFSLSSSSPAIDAGDPAQQYNDLEDPDNPGFALWPSLGGVRNDMGAYGGPDPLGMIAANDIKEPETITSILPTTFVLEPVWPNPFNGTTACRFQVAAPTFMTIRLYNISGRFVKTIQAGEYQPGEHLMTIPMHDLASGLYFLVCEAGEGIHTQKLVLLR